MRSKSMGWFLFDNGLRHERVKSSRKIWLKKAITCKIPFGTLQKWNNNNCQRSCRKPIKHLFAKKIIIGILEYVLVSVIRLRDWWILKKLCTHEKSHLWFSNYLMRLSIQQRLNWSFLLIKQIIVFFVLLY